MSDTGDFGFSNDDWLDNARNAESPMSLGSIGEFELLEEVGRGGQGVVWKAKQPGTDRIIALKRLLAGSLASASMRKRFEREVEAAASLSHPGIVTVYAMEVVSGQPMLAMEWVDGVPCTEWTQGPVDSQETSHCRDPQVALELFLRIADAVQHAHTRGIVHRDLKPSNILVDASGQPHVLDFGLAKRLSGGDDSVLTGADQVLGTPAYAAPEQLRASAAQVDERADIYSLGVVLFEMLTSARPYPKTASVVELIAAVERGKPKRPSALDPRLSKEHDAIVMRAMASEPGERYPSVTAFAADARRLLEGQPVLAVAPSSLYYMRKLVARNRVAASLLLSLVLVATSFGAYSAVQARRLSNSNAELRDTIQRLSETRIDLNSARETMKNPPAWVQEEADRTLKDFLPPCLIEPEGTTNLDAELKDFDQDFWGDPKADAGKAPQ